MPHTHTKHKMQISLTPPTKSPQFRTRKPYLIHKKPNTRQNHWNLPPPSPQKPYSIQKEPIPRQRGLLPHTSTHKSLMPHTKSRLQQTQRGLTPHLRMIQGVIHKRANYNTHRGLTPHTPANDTRSHTKSRLQQTQGSNPTHTCEWYKESHKKPITTHTGV